MKLFMVNIATPSYTRAISIMDYVLSKDMDSIMLIDIANSKGTSEIVSILKANGYIVTIRLPEERERGVLYASRLKYTVNQDFFCSISSRFVDVSHKINGEIIRILGLYVPNRNSSSLSLERKRVFINSVIASINTKQTLILGDFNVISRNHKPTTNRFRQWEYDFYDEMTSKYIDLSYEKYNTHVHTWFNSRGVSYKYDYAFLARDSHYDCDIEIDSNIYNKALSDHKGQIITITQNK